MDGIGAPIEIAIANLLILLIHLHAVDPGISSTQTLLNISIESFESSVFCLLRLCYQSW